MVSRSRRWRRMLMVAVMVGALPATIVFAVLKASAPSISVPWWRSAAIDPNANPCVAPRGLSFCGPIQQRSPATGTPPAAATETVTETVADAAAPTGDDSPRRVARAESHLVMATASLGEQHEVLPLGARHDLGVFGTTIKGGSGVGPGAIGNGGSGRARPQSGSADAVALVSDGILPASPDSTVPTATEPLPDVKTGTGSVPSAPGSTGGSHSTTPEAPTGPVHQEPRIVRVEPGNDSSQSETPRHGGTAEPGHDVDHGGGAIEQPGFGEHPATVGELAGGNDHETPGLHLGPKGGEPMSSTPEPSSILLIGTGVVGLAGFLRRRRGSKDHA